MQFGSKVVCVLKQLNKQCQQKTGEGLRRISNSEKFFIRVAAQGRILFFFLL